MDYRVLVLALLAGLAACSIVLFAQSHGVHRWSRKLHRLFLRREFASRSVALRSSPEIDGAAGRSVAPSGHQVSSQERISSPVTETEAYLIETLSEFRLLQGQPTGVIVITDNGSDAKAHRTNCQCLSEKNFKKKVVAGERKGGRYYFFVRFDDAERELNARWCKSCVDKNGRIHATGTDPESGQPPTLEQKLGQYSVEDVPTRWARLEQHADEPSQTH